MDSLLCLSFLLCAVILAKNMALAAAEAVAIVPIPGNAIQIRKLKIDKNAYKLYSNTSVL